MGAVNTTYTFTATDTITSTKMNNIIDQTVVTDEAIVGNTLEVSGGKLRVRAGGITSNEMGAASVTSTAIVDGTIVNADINASAAIAGTKISPSFGSQTIQQNGSSTRILQYNASSGLVTDFGIGAITGDQNSIGLNVANATGVLSLGTNSTERMRISASGDVGIGGTSGGEQLRVQKSSGADADGELCLTDGTRLIRFNSNASSGSFNGIVSAGDQSLIFTNGTSGTGNLSIAPWSSSTSGIKITASGNVGIGTATPSSLLHVNGNMTIGTAPFNAPSGNAPIFGARAWCVFATGSGGAISSQTGGNITITRRNTGRYTGTFATAMQSANYSVIGTGNSDSVDDPTSALIISIHSKTTTQFEINITDPTSNNYFDPKDANIIVIG